MTPFAIYVLKVILISGFLSGYYYLVLRNGRFHEWNRYYLILSVLISLTLPFAKWSSLFSGYSGSRHIYAVELHTFTFSAAGRVAPSAGWSWTTWSLFLYLFISIILAGSLVAGILKIRSRIRRGEKERFPVFTLVRHPKVESPFSFFRYIFWNDLLAIHSAEGNHIFRHELAHVKERHSVDKLLMEIILILFWINPFFHLIRKELHIIHEFIADRRACHNGPDSGSSDYLSPQDYATLLVKQCLRTAPIRVASPFIQKELTRRVRMLVRNNTPRFTYIKRVMAIPLILFIALFFVFLQSQAGAAPSSIRSATSKIRETITATEKNLQPRKIVKWGGPADTRKRASRDAHVANPKPPVLKSFTGQLRDESHGPAIEDAGIEPSIVFKFVQQMPSFPGGEDALIKYLSSHVHYPAVARENGIQGTVVVQFNVNPDGHLNHVTTVGKRLGGGLEQEAVRLVNSMPDWIAGKQNGKKVAVQYSLPVRFVLQGGDEKNAGEGHSNIAPPPPLPPSSSASGNRDPGNVKVFSLAEQMPSFPGGEEALTKYLRDHIHYPMDARENGIQGTVVVRFIVNPDGHLSHIATIGPPRGGGLEEESIRVVKGMPDWIAGRQNGKKVAVQYSLPVRFVLQ